MRRSTRIAGPTFFLTSYYAALALLVAGIRRFAPELSSYLPFGGTQALAELNADQVEIVSTFATGQVFQRIETLTLSMSIIGALLLMTPISWVYFMTTRRKQIDRSFAQTMIVLPVIVAGIAMIVHNSIALAFSLAGIVAAVRFRFTLSEPSLTLYIFAAITVGLGAGIGALGISFVTSVAFVYVNLLLWKLNYGADLNTRFFSFITGRGVDDKDL